jgi:hypothetical protein
MIVEKIRCNLCPTEVAKLSVFPNTWLQFKVTKYNGQVSIDWHVCPECRPKLPEELRSAVIFLESK